MAPNETTAGTIAGYFDNHADAQKAVEALQDAGFTSAHLGVAHRGGYGSDSATSDSGSATSNTSSKVGAKSHGVWDKVKNFFEGSPEAYSGERSEGDLGTREITPEYNYDHDDFHQNLNGLNVPEDRSRYFAHRFGSGSEGAVVTVNAGDRAAEAQQILARFGADLGDNASSYDYSSAGTTSAGTGTGQGQVEGTQNIQLLGEILRVQKERVNRGEVRLRKEVITETQTVQVPVTREELVIERRPVDGTTQASGTVGDGQEVRIPLSEETASLDKSTVVREEVAVGKKPVGEVRDLTGEVRREELVVDDTTKKAVNQ
jgi:uncharacterized protein (TIGR02271 family)